MATAKPRVLVAHDLPGTAVIRLRESFDVDQWLGPDAMPRDELLRRLEACDGFVSTINERVDPELIERAPQLRVVGQMAVGVDNIDVAACTRMGIAVTHTPGVLTNATADLTMALMLAAARRLPEATQAMLDGSWSAWHPTWLAGMELSGRTLGIVGYGAIGRAVEVRAHAFGMSTVYTSRSGGVPLRHLLEVSDIVSLHCPLTPETRGLLGDDAFAAMRPTSILVNTARGAVVDQDALVSALTSGQITAAALDVTTPEPLPAGHPLTRMANCIVVPHIGSATMETRTRMADRAVNGVCDVLTGRRPAHLLNPEVLQ